MSNDLAVLALLRALTASSSSSSAQPATRLAQINPFDSQPQPQFVVQSQTPQSQPQIQIQSQSQSQSQSQFTHPFAAVQRAVPVLPTSLDALTPELILAFVLHPSILPTLKSLHKSQSILETTLLERRRDLEHTLQVEKMRLDVGIQAKTQAGRKVSTLDEKRNLSYVQHRFRLREADRKIYSDLADFENRGWEKLFMIMASSSLSLRSGEAVDVKPWMHLVPRLREMMWSRASWERVWSEIK